jgi:hypothetical protein
VPIVNTKNPYLENGFNDWTVQNNLLPNNQSFETDIGTNDSNENDKNDTNLFNKIKSFIKTELKNEKEKEKEEKELPISKYEEAYRQTHDIPKHNSRVDEERCPSCKPCNKYPEPAFNCNINQNVPRPVINSFSTFGM